MQLFPNSLSLSQKYRSKIGIFDSLVNCRYLVFSIFVKFEATALIDEICDNRTESKHKQTALV